MMNFFRSFFSFRSNNHESVVFAKDDTDLIAISRCGRCFDLYNVHKKAAITLPCGHTFCRQCIEQTSENNYITCSKCNIDMFIKQGSLQRNVALTQFLEKLNLLDEPANHHILGISDEDIIVFQKDDKRLLELAECCICTEVYDECVHVPVTAMCGHTFCMTCTQTLSGIHQHNCSVCRARYGRQISSCKKDETLLNLLTKLNLLDKIEEEEPPVNRRFPNLCCLFSCFSRCRRG